MLEAQRQKTDVRAAGAHSATVPLKCSPPCCAGQDINTDAARSSLEPEEAREWRLRHFTPR